MPIIRRILFPVDFSWKCLGTSRYVEGLAGQFEPEVLLLYVVPCGEQILAEELLLRRQTQLAQFFADGVNYKLTELCVVGEDAAAAILETVRTWKPDLVMMPTSGLGVMKRLMTGSVTANVLRAAACPVWTGSETETAPEPEAIHCRRVLCALEMSEHSQAVLEWAAWLAGQYDARRSRPMRGCGWRHFSWQQVPRARSSSRVEYLQTLWQKWPQSSALIW